MSVLNSHASCTAALVTMPPALCYSTWLLPLFYSADCLSIIST